MAGFDWAAAVQHQPGAGAAAPLSAHGYDWAQQVLGHNAKMTPAQIRAQVMPRIAAARGRMDASAAMTGNSALQNSLIGVGHGMMNVVHGGEQLGLKGLGLFDKPLAQRLEHSVDSSESVGNQAFAPLENAHPFTAGVGNVAGNIAATAPLMALGGAAAGALLPDLGEGVAATVGRAALQDAAAGALGGVTQYVGPRQSRLRNTIEGALLNAALPIGVRGATSVLGRGAHALNGVFARALPVVDSDVMRAASQHSVPLTVGEIARSVPHQKLETALDQIPMVGMGKFRARQAQAFKDAAQNLSDSFGSDTPESSQQVADAAKQVYANEKARAKELFDKVDSLSDGEKLIAPTHMQNSAAQIVNDFSGNEDLGMRPAFVDQVQKFTGMAPRNFEKFRQLRSQIGHSEAQAGFGTPEARAWASLRSGLDQDLAKHYEDTGGELGAAYKEALAHYKSNVVPFKSIPQLKSLVSGHMDIDSLLNTFVKNERPQLAQKLMSNLTPDGQQALRGMVLKKGLEKANLGGAREGVKFDPRRFATYWENLGKTRDALFTPEHRALIDGYAKLARVAPRAADYAEFIHRPTGLKAGVLGMGVTEGVGIATHPHVALPAIFSGIGLRKMLTEPWGQKILTRAARTNSESALKGYLKQAVAGFRLTMVNGARYMGPALINQMNSRGGRTPPTATQPLIAQPMPQ